MQGSPAETGTPEPDRPQYDSPASCVIAQKYSSSTFASLWLHSRQEEFGAFQKIVLFQFFYFLKKTT